MIDTHDLGTFDSFEKVWDLYPSGGCPGDYVTVDGVLVSWNEGQRFWGDPKTFQQNIKYEKIEGNVEIAGNLKVDGELSGKKAIFDEIEVGNIKVSNIDLFKGKDSYSVALSSYDAVVAVDSYGRVDSSIYDIINIIEGNEAVIPLNYNIDTTKYKIKTAIQAYKGYVKLVYDTIIGPGKYIVSIMATGCKYSIYDGVITITEVSQDKATLVISINCEDVSTFTKTFTLTRIYGEKGLDGTDIQMCFKLSKVLNVEGPISKDLDDYIPEGWTKNPTGTNEIYRYEFVTKRLKVSGVWKAFSTPALFSKWTSDGSSPYFLNLTNDSVTLPADKDGNVTDYSVSESILQLYLGNKLITEKVSFSIKSKTDGITAIIIDGVLMVIDMISYLKSGVVTIEAFVNDISIGTIVYSIAKACAGLDGTPAKIYKLDLSSAVITKDKKGAFDVSTLTATAYRIIGNKLPVIDNTLYICYKRSGDADWVEYTGPINIVEGTTSIEVSLYNVAGGTLLDSERIPVVIDGIDGTDGEPGIPGTTYYTWIKFANDAVGSGLSDYPDGKSYIGIAYNKLTAAESATPSDYAWALIKGTDGQPGAAGTNGATLYTWIKYSDYADGTSMYDVPTASTVYIGLAVNKTTATESTVKTDYTWSKFKGEQGPQGPQGDQGVQGSLGRMPYPAGAYDPLTTYTRDGSKCPFVQDVQAYYYLNADSATGIKPSTDSTGTWKAFNMLKWIFSEVLFSDFGKLASAVFSGDFMFSQQGTLNIPVFKWSYTTPTTPAGGTYANPVPTGWSNTIPTSTGGSLYYSIRKLNANGINQDSAWASPVAMVDTSSIKFKFTSIESPTDPNADLTDWSSSVLAGAKWFAVSTYYGGIWSSYTTIKFLSSFGYDNFTGSSNSNDAFIPNYFVNFLTGNFRAVSGVVGLLQMISGAMVGRDTSGIERIRFSSGPIDSLSALTNSWESISEGVLNDSSYMFVTNSYGFFTGYNDTAIAEKLFSLSSPGSIKLINPVFSHSFSPSNYIPSGIGSLKVSILDSNNNVVYEPTTNVTNAIFLAAGTYKVRLTTDVHIAGEGDSSTRYMFRYSVGFNSIELQKASTRTMIGSNGFYSMFGINSYLYYRSDFGLQVRYGNFGFRILSDGIKYSNTMANATPTWSTLIS